MKKTTDFYSDNSSRTDEKIRKTLNAEFALPDPVKQAQKEAFQKIRKMADNSRRPDPVVSAEPSSMKHTPRKSRRKPIKKSSKIFRNSLRILAGAAAAAAVFSGICIANPAWASRLPVIGNIFEKLGDSLGFSGDYSDYAKPLENTSDMPASDSSEPSHTEASDAAYTKTVNGVTVSLSEIYCNDLALYISLIIKSHEPFPDTLISQEDSTAWISLGKDSSLSLSYNPSSFIGDWQLDGKFLDDYTYAGVYRLDLDLASINDAEYARYYKDRDDFLKEKGFDMEHMEYTETTLSDIAAALGMTEFSEDQIAAVGGPDINDYDLKLDAPEEFTAQFHIRNIMGELPPEKHTTPEVPQELIDEYNQKMAEHGLDIDNYENFTEEEKDIEYELFKEMNRKYDAMYPDTNSEYTQWTIKGDWSFDLSITKDHKNTVTKSVNLFTGDGFGIADVILSPFELKLNLANPSADYVAVAVDANGDPFSNGKFGGPMDLYAVQDRDVSKISLYICDATEYFNELKGYCLGSDYEERKKTQTYGQYLAEHSIAHTEVSFNC